MKFNKMFYVIIPVSIILFAFLIYPTMYKYDKLDQKYPVKINRLTGETEILRGDSWINTSESKVYEDKMLSYKEEIATMIRTQNDEISEKVASSIKDEIISELQQQMAAVEEEITAYKEHKTDPNNYFTTGDSEKTVKEIMGTPDDITKVGPYTTWYYGRSLVKFENGTVNGWSNDDGNLMIR